MDDEVVTDRASDLAMCRRALDELVTAIVRHDQERSGKRMVERIEIVPFSKLTDPDWMAVHAVTTNPVRAAMRLGVRRVAQVIYGLGGMDALHDAMERVSAMDAANEGRRIAIMDSAFNGVGAGDDRWWS